VFLPVALVVDELITMMFAGLFSPPSLFPSSAPGFRLAALRPCSAIAMAMAVLSFFWLSSVIVSTP